MLTRKSLSYAFIQSEPTLYLSWSRTLTKKSKRLAQGEGRPYQWTPCVHLKTLPVQKANSKRINKTIKPTLRADEIMHTAHSFHIIPDRPAVDYCGRRN